MLIFTSVMSGVEELFRVSCAFNVSFAEEKESSLHGAAGNGDAHVHDRVFQWVSCPDMNCLLFR